MAKKKASKRASPKKEAESIVVTVDDAHMSSIQEVAKRLRARGMKVQEVMEGIGIISGTYGKEASSLNRIRGVSSVEKQPRFQLPPPDSDVQ
jgi:hypothetical protein